MSYPNPLWWLSILRSVILFFAFTRIGFPVPSSNPVIISGSFHSGKILETSSSRVKRPFSTHCSAAIVVMSFVHDATQKVVSGLSAGAPGSEEMVPAVVTYWSFPTHNISQGAD